MNILSPAEKNAARLKLAAACLEKRWHAAADILCRNVLDGDPGNRAAHEIIAQIAERLQVGRRGHGRLYLVIKSWGQGFWSDVSHVACGLLLAELTGRIPVVWWGTRSRFGGTQDYNAFEAYFEPVSDATPPEVATAQSPFFPDSWTADNLLTETALVARPFNERPGVIDFLGRTETVCVADFYLSMAELAPWIPEGHPLAGQSAGNLFRYAIARNLRPVAAIAEAVDAFVRHNFGAERFVAAHVRGSDKAKELVGMEQAIDSVFSRLDAISGGHRIFLMTDDQRIADQAIARYGTRVVLTDCLRTGSTTGLHFAEGADGLRLGREVMTDAYVALRAAHFVGLGASNPSAMVSLMKPWPPGACELLGRSILLRRSAFLYLPHRFAPLAQPDP